MYRTTTTLIICMCMEEKKKAKEGKCKDSIVGLVDNKVVEVRHPTGKQEWFSTKKKKEKENLNFSVNY